METNIKELILKAYKAREKSFCPYSNFAVGAALLCEDGSIYTGCNIENQSFSLTLCAERVAFSKAVSDGKRDFLAISICGGKENNTDFCPPCGACLQFMREFCPDDFKIILTKDINSDEVNIFDLGDLIPLKFDNLK